MTPSSTTSPLPPATPAQPEWWAQGLLFENCTCQVVCPGHVHFDQLCTHERCKGFWAIRFDDGDFGGTSLAGARAVIAYDTPQHMIDGDWTEVIIIDATATPAVRSAVEQILTGRAGGPWIKLAKFVGRQLDTRYLPIVIEEAGPTRRVRVENLLEGQITDIRGRDRSRPVTLENCFNQVHAPEQVLARGDTRYDDGVIVVASQGTHGLHSRFRWSASGATVA
jgi:hypothetical protein